MPRQDTQSAEQRANQKEASIHRSEVERSSAFEARSQRESSTLSDNENGNDHHKSVKLSNSPIFIGTDDPI